ncbi:hypothetical protein HK405_012188, partial [Cladochytrium tenue]
MMPSFFTAKAAKATALTGLVSLLAAISGTSASSSGSGATAGVSLHLHRASNVATGSAQVHLPRTVSWDQATSVLAHLLGISDGLRPNGSPIDGTDFDYTGVLNDQKVIAVAGDLFDGPAASLLVLLKGMDSEDIPVPVTFDVHSSHAPSSRLVSAYLNDISSMVASTPRSVVFTVSSEDQNTAIAGAARVTLRSKKPIVMISDSTPSSLAISAKEIASTSYEDVSAHFVEKFGADGAVFDQTEEDERMFMIEADFISSLFEAIRIQGLHDRKNDRPTHGDFYAISLTKLQMIAAFDSAYANGAVEILSVAPTVSDAATATEPRLHRRS